MKTLDIILITFCLLSFINSTCEPDEENNKIRDDDDCTKRAFSEDEVANEAYKCCYLKQKVDAVTFKGNRYQCITINQNQYNYIKDLIKSYENEAGVKDVSIDCKSSYIKLGLLLGFLSFVF